MSLHNLPKVKELDKKHWDQIQKKFDNLIKPVGSLARLEDITCMYAAAHHLEEFTYPKRALLLFIAEHEDECPCYKKNAAYFKKEILSKTHEINILAETFQADLFPVFNTTTTAQAAFSLGEKTVEQAREAGAEILGLGSFSSNTREEIVALSFRKFAEISQKTGISADLPAEVVALLDKQAEVKSDTLALLSRFKSFNILSMTGAILKACSLNMPIYLDGVESLLAAAAALELEPLVKDYLVAVSTTSEVGQDILLYETGLATMLDLKLALPSGQAALLGFSLLDAGIKAFNEMDAFGKVHFPLGDIS